MHAEDADVAGLLLRAKGGDACAIKQLYMRCSLVYPYVLRLCGDAALARDVHHDTVIEIWKGGAVFRRESRFSTWVIGIARHLAFDALARQRRELVSDVELDAMDDDDAAQALHEVAARSATEMDPSQLLGQRQQAEGVKRCIGKLSARLGECLLLVYYAQMSQAEVATLLGLNLGTVKTRVRDAHRQIEHCLSRVIKGAAR